MKKTSEEIKKEIEKKIEPMNKMLVGLDENGEIIAVETDEPEEGMFKVSENETKEKKR